MRPCPRLVSFVSIWLLALLLSLAGGIVRSAHADEPPALSAKERSKARRLVKQAGEYKREGERHARRKRKAQADKSFRKAAVAYRDAYRITQAAPLLVDLGAVYRARGELGFALRVYRKYLELDGDGKSADAARSAVEELEGEIDGIRGSGEEPAAGDPELDPTDLIGPEPEPEPEPVVEPEPEEPDETPALALDSGDGKAGKKARPGPGRLFKWSGLGAGGTGVALLGVGVFFGLDARSKANTLSAKQDPWTPADRQLVASGQSAETRMYIFTTVGVVLAAGGAALYYYGMTQDRDAAKKSSSGPDAASAGLGPTITPVLTPDGATITFTGHF